MTKNPGQRKLDHSRTGTEEIAMECRGFGGGWIRSLAVIVVERRVDQHSAGVADGQWADTRDAVVL